MNCLSIIVLATLYIKPMKESGLDYQERTSGKNAYVVDYQKSVHG